jgi:hypothetical protein
MMVRNVLVLFLLTIFVIGPGQASAQPKPVNEYMACATTGEYRKLVAYDQKRAANRFNYLRSGKCRGGYQKCYRDFYRDYPPLRGVDCKFIRDGRLDLDKKGFGYYCVRQKGWPNCRWINPVALKRVCSFSEDRTVWRCRNRF